MILRLLLIGTLSTHVFAFVTKAYFLRSDGISHELSIKSSGWANIQFSMPAYRTKQARLYSKNEKGFRCSHETNTTISQETIRLAKLLKDRPFFNVGVVGGSICAKAFEEKVCSPCKNPT